MERKRLILTRKSGEALWVGDARVTVEKHRGQIRVVVEALETSEELRARPAT